MNDTTARPLVVYSASGICDGDPAHEVSLIWDGTRGTAWGTYYRDPDSRDDEGVNCTDAVRDRHILTVDCGQHRDPEGAETCPGAVTFNLAAPRAWVPYNPGSHGFLLDRAPLTVTDVT
jgi:hypothetical protein